MLIETIAFEIRNFTTGESEEFLIENTEANFEKVCAHRFTRDIKIAKTFDFEFEKKQNTPIEFIHPLILAAVLSDNHVNVDELVAA